MKEASFWTSALEEGARFPLINLYMVERSSSQYAVRALTFTSWFLIKSDNKSENSDIAMTPLIYNYNNRVLKSCRKVKNIWRKSLSTKLATCCRCIKKV